MRANSPRKSKSISLPLFLPMSLHRCPFVHLSLSQNACTYTRAIHVCIHSNATSDFSTQVAEVKERLEEAQLRLSETRADKDRVESECRKDKEILKSKVDDLEVCL